MNCIPWTLLIASMARMTVAQGGFTASETDTVEAFLRGNFATGNAGMVIGVIDTNGKRIFSAGKLGNGSDRAVDGDTVFELGSVTKVFTALLALEAASRGEVKLDAPASTYLPPSVKMPAFKGREITLRHLAAQDSGLPFHHGNVNNWETKGYTIKEIKKACEAVTAQDLYAFLPTCTLAEAPGTRFVYSNPGMALLGHVVELKTGHTYESLVVDRICKPLEMEDTRISLTPAQKERLAMGHYLNGEPSENIQLQVMAPAGRFFSTANDLLRFLSANLGFTQTKLNSLLQEMQIPIHTGSPKFGSTAMPWMDEGVFQPPGSDLLGHGGGGFGYLAFMGFDKKKLRAVVVLSNQMAITAHAVGWTLLQGMPLTRENVASMVRELVGVGLAFEIHEPSSLLRITTVYPNSSAGEAGLKAGLLVRSIGGVPVHGKSTEECLALLRGPEGSEVLLEVQVPNQRESRTVPLLRRKFLTSSDAIK